MKLIVEDFSGYVLSHVELKRKWSIGLKWIEPRLVESIKRISKSIKVAKPLFEFTTRHIDTPPSIESKMEHKTPQFFLRNIPRIQRMEEDPDALPYKDQGMPVLSKIQIRPAKLVYYERPKFIEYFSVNDVKWLQRVLSKTLREEVWTDRFSKEIKESLMTGLWLSNPDPIDIYRPPFWKRPEDKK